MQKAIFLAMSALGDLLCSTPALGAFRVRWPDTKIIYVVQSAGFCRILENNPDIDLILYSEQLYLHGVPSQTVAWLQSLPLDLREPAELYQLDLRRVCTNDQVFYEHMSRAFARLVGVEIDSVRPRIVLTDVDRRGASLFTGKPYVVFSMHSITNPPRSDGRGGKKDWPLEYWSELATWITENTDCEIFAVGSEREQPLACPQVRWLYGLPIRTVAALLESAACVVTLENGIGHLAAAVDAPTVIIYADIMPREWAEPVESTTARVVYGDPASIPCDDVVTAVQDVLSARASETSP